MGLYQSQKKREKYFLDGFSLLNNKGKPTYYANIQHTNQQIIAVSKKDDGYQKYKNENRYFTKSRHKKQKISKQGWSDYKIMNQS